MKKRKVRKPRDLKIMFKRRLHVVSALITAGGVVEIHPHLGMDEKECRTLSAWLLKAAAWLEQQGEGK